MSIFATWLSCLITMKQCSSFEHKINIYLKTGVNGMCKNYGNFGRAVTSSTRRHVQIYRNFFSGMFFLIFIINLAVLVSILFTSNRWFELPQMTMLYKMTDDKIPWK